VILDIEFFGEGYCCFFVGVGKMKALIFLYQLWTHLKPIIIIFCVVCIVWIELSLLFPRFPLTFVFRRLFRRFGILLWFFHFFKIFLFFLFFLTNFNIFHGKTTFQICHEGILNVLQFLIIHGFCHLAH